MWCAVVHTVIQDYFFWPVVNRQSHGVEYYKRTRPKQDKMRRYMQTWDFELVCGYAGLHPEFVVDVIARLELHGR